MCIISRRCLRNFCVQFVVHSLLSDTPNLPTVKTLNNLFVCLWKQWKRDCIHVSITSKMCVIRNNSKYRAENDWQCLEVMAEGHNENGKPSKNSLCTCEAAKILGFQGKKS